MGRFSTMFGNVWHAENLCWLPAGLPGSQCTELQILLISSKCVNFAAALSVFHHSCPKQKIDRRGFFLLPLKPAAGFPSMAKCQDLYLTKQFCVSAADCISLKVFDVSHGSQPESHGSIRTDFGPELVPVQMMLLHLVLLSIENPGCPISGNSLPLVCGAVPSPKAIPWHFLFFTFSLQLTLGHQHWPY